MYGHYIYDDMIQGRLPASTTHNLGHLADSMLVMKDLPKDESAFSWRAVSQYLIMDIVDTSCLTVRSLIPYHMRRLANPDNLVTTLRPRRMDGARPAMRARTSYNPLGGGHRTAADGGRGVRLDTC